MQTLSAPPPPPQPFLRLHVWGFALASGVTALIAGLIAWPFRIMMMARAAARYGMYGAPWPGGPHAPMHHPGLGLWYLLGLVILFIWASVFGTILAAFYNAFIPKR